jgi:hypothetical protein
MAAAINKKYFLGVCVCFDAGAGVSRTGSNASELDFSHLEDCAMVPD